MYYGVVKVLVLELQFNSTVATAQARFQSDVSINFHSKATVLARVFLGVDS